MAFDRAHSEGEHFLRELQRQAWELNPPPPGSSLAQAAEMRKALRQRIAADPSFADEFRGKFRDASEADRTRAEAFIAAGEYEDPFAYRVAMEAVTDVERAFAELGRPVPAVVVGTARTGHVNAMACAPGPGPDTRVVVIDGALLPFLADVALLVARLLPAGRDDESTTLSMDAQLINAHLQANAELVERAADDAVRFVTGDYPIEQLLSPEDEALPEGIKRFANVLYRLMTVFVVGHEYAHIHRGHVGQMVGDNSPPAVGLASRAEVIYDWLLESEADAGGVEVALRVAVWYSIEPSIAYLASELFFVAEQIILLGEAIQRNGSLDKAIDEVNALDAAALETPELVAPHLSHPPPLLRRKTLRMILRDSTKPETFEAVVGGARAFDKAFTQILSFLALELERRLVTAEHQRPRPT